MVQENCLYIAAYFALVIFLDNRIFGSLICCFNTFALHLVQTRAKKKKKNGQSLQ